MPMKRRRGFPPRALPLMGSITQRTELCFRHSSHFLKYVGDIQPIPPSAAGEDLRRTDGRGMGASWALACRSLGNELT